MADLSLDEAIERTLASLELWFRRAGGRASEKPYEFIAGMTGATPGAVAQTMSKFAKKYYPELMTGRQSTAGNINIPTCLLSAQILTLNNSAL